LGSDRVFDVIGEVIPGQSLKELIVQAITNRRTLEEIIADIETLPDEEAVRKAREAVLEGLATRHIDLQRVLAEDRRARENRLVPEYIERFFERACKFLNIPLERRRDGLWRVPNVPYEVRNVSQTLRHCFGEVFREYSKLAFDKATARRQEAVFVAPGHPLLEAVIERLLTECADDVRRKAVFVDPDGRLDGWLLFLEGEVCDGANQVAGRRLFAVYQSINGELRLVHPSVLWDLKPSQTTTLEAKPRAEEAIVFAIDQALEAYRSELLAERMRQAAIKRKYGRRSLEQMILESEAKLIEYETRRAKGENLPEVESLNEQRRKEELEMRKRALEEEIRRETSLLPSTPKILGVVRVFPQPAVDQSMRSDAQVEAIGMQVAMQYEREHGRNPEDVSAENVGYDIRSTSPSGEVRYIEVKARATTGAIVFTPNEWLMAQRLGNEYWLYVVESAATQPRLRIIQNPAAKLQPEEVVEIVRYVVKNWQEVSNER
jgi:hypothetical protein